MKPRGIVRLIAGLCTLALLPGDAWAMGLSPTRVQEQAAPASDQSNQLSADELDSLVAPIALYPDPLLAQVLAASTYPIEIMELQQWLQKNPGLTGQALADAVKQQNWDPSIQALAALPDVVKRLANDIQWTTNLGNAFLAQQSDVMAAVQRMRQKAQAKGTLQSTSQQTVQTQTVENQKVIVIQPADPQVVYVPTYDPVVVWGPPIYPYPPIWYPPPGYYAAGLAISFGVGVALGAFWGGGGWGWGCGWGHNNITINNNNTFINNNNIHNGNNNFNNRTGNNTWQHNPAHRDGAPYPDRNTANKYGGTTRGSSMAQRQANARQQIGRQGGNFGGDRAGGGNFGGNRPGGGSNFGGSRAGGNNSLGGRGNFDGGGNRSWSGGGADRAGNYDLGRSSSAGNRDAFGGGDRGFSGSYDRANSSRGSFSRGGGGFGGGGFRGGGGGRRR